MPENPNKEHKNASGRSRDSDDTSKKSRRCCQVCLCHLQSHRPYFQKHKICSKHFSAESVTMPNSTIPMRWCQQCSKLQPLDQFNGTKKTCQQRLMLHNARRRRACKEDDGQDDAPSENDTSTDSKTQTTSAGRRRSNKDNKTTKQAEESKPTTAGTSAVTTSDTVETEPHGDEVGDDDGRTSNSLDPYLPDDDIMDILFSSMGYGVQPPLPQMFPVPPLPQFTSLYEKTEQLVSPPPAAYDRYDEFDAILERFDFNLPALAP